MPVSVNLYWVILSLVIGLAVLSLLSHFAVRRHAGLVWLAFALIIGGIAVPVYVNSKAGPSTLALLATLDTLAAYAVSQAARLVVRAGRSSTPVALVGASGWALSIILISSGTGPVVIQAIPFQLGGLLFIADALAALFRRRCRTGDYALIAGMGAYFASLLVRLPFYPALMEEGRAYAELGAQWLNGFMLATSSVYVPLVVLSIIARDLSAHIEEYRETSIRDGLTGLLTRLAFEQAAREASPRYGALILCDLDHFKALNDSYGHPAGDEALRAFARIWNDAAPITGRVGGEEFAMLLPGKTLVQAESIATQIRTAYANARPAGVGEIKLTASFGIAAYGGREGFRETLIKADRALYRAKRQGRDCVVLHGTLAGEEANTILRTA